MILLSVSHHCHYINGVLKTSALAHPWTWFGLQYYGYISYVFVFMETRIVYLVFVDKYIELQPSWLILHPNAVRWDVKYLTNWKGSWCALLIKYEKGSRHKIGWIILGISIIISFILDILTTEIITMQHRWTRFIKMQIPRFHVSHCFKFHRCFKISSSALMYCPNITSGTNTVYNRALICFTNFYVRQCWIA